MRAAFLFLALMSTVGALVHGGMHRYSTVGKRQKVLLQRNRGIRVRGGNTQGAAATSMSAMAVFTDKVAPTLGCFVANGMFLSGLPAVLDARKQKSLGELNPIPFPMALGNALGWLIYAYVTKNPYVFWSNALGMLVALYMTMTGLTLADEAARANLEKLVLGSFFILMNSGWISAKYFSSDKARQLLAGYVANAFLLVYYSSPLSTMAKVFKEKSAASINALVSSFTVLNGSLWTIYGLAVADKFIWVPNFVGAVLGVVQLTLVGIFGTAKK